MNNLLKRLLKNFIKNDSILFTKQGGYKKFYYYGFLSTAVVTGALIHRHQILNYVQPKFLYAQEITPIEQNEIEHDLLNPNPRRQIFEHFASIEYNGVFYMTPNDFIESVTGQKRVANTKRRILTSKEYEKYLKDTPNKKKASKIFFRNLENNGLITYSEYIFLLCVITKPKSSFEIAFNMFDIDGSKTVDKKEFLVLERVFNTNENQIETDYGMTKIFERENDSTIEKVSKKNPLKNVDVTTNPLIQSLKVIEAPMTIDTTLLVHFFGKKGNEILNYEDFKNFMLNLQTEILEVEFNQFSKGLNKLTEVEFAEILLRYTIFDDETKAKKIAKLESQMDGYKRGIPFESFVQFSTLMNTLQDFSLAIKYHTLANKSINKKEFQRAVKVSTGSELDNQVVDVIFKVFDEDNDEHLSYKEFIAVMKDRLRRNPKSYFKNYNQYLNETEPFSKKFKSCMKQKLKKDDYYS